MSTIFVRLYNYFQQHKFIFYLSLIISVVGMAYCALKINFDENIAHFFPDTKDSKNITTVFDNLKIKDKIIVLFSATDTTNQPDFEVFIEEAEIFKNNILSKVGNEYIKNVLLKVDESSIKQVSSFIYDNLPLFLTDDDYYRIDSLLSTQKIKDIMYQNYTNLVSPAGMVLKDYIMRDPLGIASSTLKSLQNFQLEINYQLNNDYIFTGDGSTLLMFITPTYGTSSTGKNEVLITSIENEIRDLNNLNPTIKIEYFGGPSIGVYNARQIKADTLLTVFVSMLVIIVFMSLVFKRKIDILLIITPVIFGGLFSLFFISIFKGSISAIAVGAGSVVLGIALSYSIHMIAHQSQVASQRQLIKELAYPLTVGSFTTIGAFLGLLFTSSALLRDLGLFAALALIGTTLFCLIYLPHFLSGQVNQKQGYILRAIEKFNAYPFEKNKWLVIAIITLTTICFFTSKHVGFESDMTRLGYEPKHLKQTEQKLLNLFNNDTNKTVIFVTVGKTFTEAVQAYEHTNQKLHELKQHKLINNYASVERFLVPTNIQSERIKKWNFFWTDEHKNFVKQEIQNESKKYHFRNNAFSDFYAWLDKSFITFDLNENESIFTNMLEDWQTSANNLTMLVSQVSLSEKNKEHVYNYFENSNDVVIFDRAYFTSKWISAVNTDFYLVLYISSFLIFFALLISYGRIELTFISFLPMIISWVIIVGLMGILGIEFNIINIILSTFIFGIGDDFSIFIMDGLQNKYRTGKAILNSHKTAIFFSAFTIVTGMGAMIVAKHPALQSISYMSILGMIVVVVVAYTLQPLIFNLFIANPVLKKQQPYTLVGILQTIYAFTIFLTGCIFLRLFIALLYLIPVKKAKKKKLVCTLLMYTCRMLVTAVFFIKKKKINTCNETFKEPSIIIANHQSFIDILVLLSLNSKILMMTNKWVWKSPFFGAIIRYADYFYVGDGYENYLNRMRQKINEGYSIAIFPEGTRSYDGTIKRFHKGAFYLAEQLNIDIIPVLLYGNGMVLSKAQPFYLKRGVIATKILPRITNNNILFGNELRTRTKNITNYMRDEYTKLYTQLNTPENPYFYNALIKNYIYKGPVEEWYTRIKVNMEKNYSFYNKIISHNACITDIGCGYGMLAYMLTMLAPKRNVLGIDYDEDKINIAQNGYLKNNQIKFINTNVIEYSLPKSDVFIMNDVLHYMTFENQVKVIEKCIDQLNTNGMIIIRDGNTNETKKQRLTRFTELLSTRIFKFNKVQNQLYFTSATDIQKIAEKYNMKIEMVQNDKFTSNTIYILKNKNNE